MNTHQHNRCPRSRDNLNNPPSNYSHYSCSPIPTNPIYNRRNQQSSTNSKNHRNLLNSTNRNRIISSNTLHIRHHNSILFSHTYLPRRKLRLNYPISPCQRSFHILYLPIHTRRTRNLLWIIHLHRNMKCRHHLTIHS
jgi:hypothetical protein